MAPRAPRAVGVESSTSARLTGTCPCRILFVSHVSQVGGAEHSLLTLLRGLVATGAYELHAALPESDGALGTALRELGGVTLHPIPELGVLRRGLSSIARLFRGRRALARFARDLAPDLVHANTDVAMLFASGIRRGSGGPRIVWHIRDMRRLGRLGRYLRARSDARVAVSNAVAVRYGLDPSSEDRVIPNGIDLARFRPATGRAETRAELGLAPDAIVCLSIGQDVPWKRLADFRALSGEGYDRVLVTYPAPGMRTAPPLPPLPLACSGEGGRVTVLPYRADIERVYRAADIYVHPAVGEAFGRTVVEALASGLPVVAADDAGPAEIVERDRCGLLVSPGDVASLEHAVRRLAGDPDLRTALGRAARSRAAEFSAEAHVARVEALYAALLRR